MEADSFNTFEFRPNISLNYNNSASTDSSASCSAAAVSVTTRSLNSGVVVGAPSFEGLGGSLIYNHNFRQRRGRSFGVRPLQSEQRQGDQGAHCSTASFLLNDSVGPLRPVCRQPRGATVSARLRLDGTAGDASKGNFLDPGLHRDYRWNNADKVLTYDRPG